MKLRNTARLLVATLLAAATIVVSSPATQAHSSEDWLRLVPPIQGPSVWDRFGYSPPSSHHIVYANWGWMNDWSVDIYQSPGAAIVSPFGSYTNAGHSVSVKVVTVGFACASQVLADGGYRIGLEARDNVTGEVLGRADIGHVANKPSSIVVGASIGPWTKLGETSRFRYSSCYQVTTDSGVHVHFEAINYHRYACYVYRSPNTALTDLTVIGRVAIHKSGQRQTC